MYEKIYKIFIICIQKHVERIDHPCAKIILPCLEVYTLEVYTYI